MTAEQANSSCETLCNPDTNCYFHVPTVVKESLDVAEMVHEVIAWISDRFLAVATVEQALIIVMSTG